ncbi:MAG: domain S-box-containing protein [Chitinophagaceae bacterium]|nr:domain S-box-containing protein [Chitinophagaceae bacterium]
MSDLKNPGFEMFDFFERTPVLVCIAGKDGFFKKINLAVIEKFGYSEEELLSRPIFSFIHPDDKELTVREREKLLRGKALVNFQNRYVAKNGNIMWLEWTSIYFSDKEVVFAIANDITEKKKIENEIERKYIKFKSLASHFKSSIEEDRKYLALELHEELAQLASVVKMDIDFVKENTPEMPEISKSRLAHAIGISGLLINTIRRISFSISPQMLEEHGLNETLEWHCKEFSMLNGIPCLFETNYDETNLTYEIQLDFFRICQEALSNVMYHAQASEVKISIEDRGDRIFLTIRDDGQGFDVDRQKQTAGLTNMRERAASINGELIIESEPGKGTRVGVIIAN